MGKRLKLKVCVSILSIALGSLCSQNYAYGVHTGLHSNNTPHQCKYSADDQRQLQTVRAQRGKKQCFLK